MAEKYLYHHFQLIKFGWVWNCWELSSIRNVKVLTNPLSSSFLIPFWFLILCIKHTCFPLWKLGGSSLSPNCLIFHKDMSCVSPLYWAPRKSFPSVNSCLSVLGKFSWIIFVHFQCFFLFRMLTVLKMNLQDELSTFLIFSISVILLYFERFLQFYFF